MFGEKVARHFAKTDEMLCHEVSDTDDGESARWQGEHSANVAVRKEQKHCHERHVEGKPDVFGKSSLRQQPMQHRSRYHGITVHS
jgi:hypothetical protein